MADYIGQITMRSGDQLPLLSFAVEDDMGTPVVLTGATSATIVLTHEDGEDPRVDPVRPMPTLSLPGYIQDPAHGFVVYDWDPSLILRPGAVQLTVVVALPSGPITAPTDRSAWIYFRPDVPTPAEDPTMPGRYDLDIYRGDTYTWRFKLWADSAHTVPVSLTGAAAKAQIRNKPGGSVVVPLGAVITLPNIIDISLAAANSQHCPSDGAWDLQITYPSGSVKTVVAGNVNTTPDVTDSTLGFSGIGTHA